MELETIKHGYEGLDKLPDENRIDYEGRRNVKAAFEKIRDFAMSDTPIDENFYVDFFIPNKGNYQNLIGSGKEPLVKQVYKIVMVDEREPEQPEAKEIVISKTDLGGQEVANAVIKITKLNGEVAINQLDNKEAKWTSEVNGGQKLKLEVGEYFFEEVAAPTGLQKVTKLKFAVEADDSVKVLEQGKNEDQTDASSEVDKNKLTVKDKAIEKDKPSSYSSSSTYRYISSQPSTKDIIVSKVSLGNDNATLVDVDGALIQVFEGENTLGKKVDEWVTKTGENHTLKNLVVGQTYTFHEVSAPNGLKVISDFTFSVDKEGKVSLNSIITNGKVDSKDGKLVVTDDREDALTKDIIVSKVSLGNDNVTLVDVEGALIQVFEGKGTSGIKIDEWITKKDKNHTLKNLLVGEVYTFHEVSAPSGLKVISDFTFSVDKNGNVILNDIISNGDVAFIDGKLMVTDDKSALAGDKNYNQKTKGKDLPKTGNDDSSNDALTFLVFFALSGLAINLGLRKVSKE